LKMINLKAVFAFAREMYPKVLTNNLSYGTAGFRGKAEDLDSCMFRMGLLASLRSMHLKGAVIGVMITASHNPEPDNGVKIIDVEGQMLDSTWEKVASNLANVDDKALEKELSIVIERFEINFNCLANVFVGMDNRYHSPRLFKAVEDGVIVLKGHSRSFGIVTTPMMHFFVVAANTNGEYGEPSEEGYYKKLMTAFDKLSENSKVCKNYKNLLIFDGANGVGALKMAKIVRHLNGLIKINLMNKGNGKINYQCGADFVKLYKQIPIGLTNVLPFTRCVSVDGDADRVVYFFKCEKNNLRLLDGDHIAVLIAEYLKELLVQQGLDLCLGVVQTAYANGASTNYILNTLNIPVACVSTGVKYLHEKAKDFDIGIYFEANGHGTVLFSNKAKKTIWEAESETLRNIVDLVNETVGDAISDILLVEYILREKDWDVKNWFGIYEDLPNLQLKVSVSNRHYIKTYDADRKCSEPTGLQEKIDELTSSLKNGRAFIRPSGTEDVVRIYAEACTQENANSLANQIADLVHQFLNENKTTL